MAAALTASFTLRLVDQFSSPLRQLQDRFEALRGAASRLGLGGFAAGIPKIQEAADAVSGLTDELQAVGRAAETGRSAWRRWADGASSALQSVRREWSAFMGSGSNRAAVPGLAEWASGRPLAQGAGSRWGAGPTSAVRVPGAPSGLDDTIAAVGAGIGLSKLMEGVRRAAEFENPIVHSAVAANLSGTAAAAFISAHRDQYDRLALATGQRNVDVAETGYNLQLTGMDKRIIDLVMPAAAQAATAYRTKIADVGGVAYALNENLGIGPDQMGVALATLGLAGRTGHFTLDKMAQYFPQEAALAGSFGMHGMGAAQQIAAALQISLKNVGMNDPGKAATNMQDFLQYIASPIARREFARYGNVDLTKMIQDGMRKGISPLEAVIAKTEQLTGGDRSRIGELFHNAEAAQFVVAMIQHKQEYLKLLETLRGVDVKTIQKDFEEVALHTDYAVQRFDASLDILTQRLGFAFVPVMDVASTGLVKLGLGFIWLDKHVPGASTAIVSVAGAFLALVAGAGAWMLIGGPVRASFGLIGNALRLAIGAITSAIGALGALSAPAWGIVATMAAVAAAIGFAADDIYEDWGRFQPFFREMWWGVEDIFRGFGQFLSGVWRGDMVEALNGLENVWGGLEGFFDGLWSTVKGVFHDFITWLDGWTGADLRGALDRMEAAIQKSAPGNYQGIAKAARAGADAGDLGLPGVTPDMTYMAPPVVVRGEITVKAAPGTSADATSSTPGLRMTTEMDRAADRRGPTLRRP